VIESGIVRQKTCIPRSDGEKEVAYAMTTWRLSLTEVAPISMNLDRLICVFSQRAKCLLGNHRERVVVGHALVRSGSKLMSARLSSGRARARLPQYHIVPSSDSPALAEAICVKLYDLLGKCLWVRSSGGVEGGLEVGGVGAGLEL
jgi:hypothetical protein